MKLAFAFFALLLNSAFSQDPWSIQPGTVELDPNGDTLKVSHILGDSPIKARVTLFNKGCQTEIGANEIVTLSSQTYFSLTSSPSVSSSATPSASLMPTWAPRKVLAPNGLAGDQFGFSIGLSATTIVAGAHLRDLNGVTEVGAVYMFSSDLTFDKQLNAINPAAIDRFGVSVAVSDSHIVVGAYADDDKGTDSGSVYLYTIAGDLVTQLFASDASAWSQFGSSLAIEGSNILVGAYRKNSGSASSVGGAYHFDTAGTEIQKFMAPTPIALDRFGNAVAISGSTFVIGAYLHDNKGTDSGTAYIFSSDGTLIQQIYPDDNTPGASFGWGVSASSSHIVVGAYTETNAQGSRAGAAYVFDLAGTRLFKLLPSNTRSDQWFGLSLVVTDELIFVGAPDTSTVGTGGEVYIFNLSGSLLKRVTAPDRAVGDQFGFSIAVLGDTLVVGAHLNDDKGTDSGSIYRFDVRHLI